MSFNLSGVLKFKCERNSSTASRILIEAVLQSSSVGPTEVTIHSNSKPLLCEDDSNTTRQKTTQHHLSVKEQGIGILNLSSCSMYVLKLEMDWRQL